METVFQWLLVLTLSCSNGPISIQVKTQDSCVRAMHELATAGEAFCLNIETGATIRG
jgi:hypothetical protein